MKKRNSNIELAKRETKQALGKAYSIKMIKQSELFNTLDKLSTYTEEKLTKKDLYELIAKCCNYMKAYSLLEYYRSEYHKLMLGVRDNGNADDTNSQD